MTTLTKLRPYATRSRPTVPQQRLTSERRIVLQQIVDVPHPVVFLPRRRALPRIVGFSDR